MATTEVFPQEGQALIGISRQDITPPVGIYGRMWGASTHEKSEGTHKPLYVTAMSIQARTGDMPAILVAVDAASLGDLDGQEAHWLRNNITAALEIDDTHLMLACSHTHASPWSARSRAYMPGGDSIEKYLQDISQAIVDAARRAVRDQAEAVVTFQTGKCSLAANRDLLDPHNPDRYLTGYNPDIPADDTVMVGRITRVSDNFVMGTIVNYACHPTSLGWDNKLISPDYVGEMREVIERETGGVPCLFLQGASGDLAPAIQYAPDMSVADQHGRQLGFSALSVLASMESAGEKLEFLRAVESGAPLGYWGTRNYPVSNTVKITAGEVTLPTKVWPTVEELEVELAKVSDSFAKERLFRKRSIAKLLSGGKEISLTVYGWSLGRILFVGVQCEVYSLWQSTLRKAFPGYAVVAITCVDYEAIGYVVPDELHDVNLYQAWQPPFSKGVMQALTDATKRQGLEAIS
jgi:hypothetical protein